MTDNLLDDLRREFGTVSSRTETSGTVAVKNKTARKWLAELVGDRAELVDKTASWPRLVVVIEGRA